MAMYIMKGLCVIGIILNVVLMLRKNKQLRANPEKDPVIGLNGEEQWQEQKKHAIATAITGFVANFLDTLGTLNVGDTVPVCVEAFLFFGFVEMDVITLVLMLVASVIGSIVMAGIVSRFDRKKVRYALFVGLFLLATVILLKVFNVPPFGTVGTALGLRGVKLVIAVVGNFIFGALMSIGVGLYAPCMAMVLALGMDAGCAFPAMMGSCAYLMAFGNGPKFIAEGRYDMFASLMQAIFGALGVLVAYIFVKSLPLETLTKVIVAVVYLTAFLYLRDAIKKGSAA